MNDWQDLTRLTQGDDIVVERIRLVEKGIAVEGAFQLPSLCRLTMEEQMFVMAFIQCHGSIKGMESILGISYPTVKNRLNSISKKLNLVDINPPFSKTDILDQLERGEISIEEAEKLLKEAR
ncbi:DUF2089 domain-containing protein [bacterium]|nr:DUF2089 domain-containing protein [bacterium]